MLSMTCLGHACVPYDCLHLRQRCNMATSVCFLADHSAMLCQESHVRIVCLSSSAHQLGGLDLQDLHFRTRKYGAWKAYGQSKLCNILFVYELARRYVTYFQNASMWQNGICAKMVIFLLASYGCYRTQGTNIEAFTLHPGVIATALWRHGCLNKMMQRVQAVLGMTKTVEQVRVQWLSVLTTKPFLLQCHISCLSCNLN